jgi:hypothetical protein
MDAEQTSLPGSPRRTGLRAIVLTVLAAFALGAGVMYWLAGGGGDSWGLGGLFDVRNDNVPQSTRPLVASSRLGATAAETATGAADARAAVQRVEQVAEQTGGIDARVAAMEQRLTRLDLQTQAAEGYAARAEGMLITFAARRAIERGQPLGFLEDQLRLRFGEGRPNAVQTVIDAGRDPVTLDQLLVQLDGLDTQLVEIPEDAGLLTRIGQELGQLFSVRTDDTPSPIAERRLERARGHLENSRIERAIAEVQAMPNAAAAADWLAQAERYAAAQRALEALESAAVLDTRDLRDGDGRPVAQPGLAD